MVLVSQDNRPAVTKGNWWIGALICAAVAVGAVALLRTDPSAKRGSGLGKEFEYQIDEYKKIPPAMLGYEQTAEFPVEMEEARAVAIGPDDRIHVAGDRTITIFALDGRLQSRISLEEEPYCLAIGNEEHAFGGRIYVGLKDRVLLFDENGKPAGSWDSLGDRAVLTSIAVAEDDIFAADAGNAVVVRYDPSGKIVGRIGKPDKARGIPGFTIPSPFFDVAVHPDGWLRVVNPGALRIEAYSFEGNLELYWGKQTNELDGFFGCCNPANFAILPDGRFVTAEKGLLRVKIYSTHGDLECVVAGPEQLDASPAAVVNESLSDHEYTAVDVAVDSAERIVVLDRPGLLVRIFEPRATEEVPQP
jgi:hypothetical protein